MKARIIYPDGRVRSVRPINGTDFSLKELQAIVGGTISIHRLPATGETLVVNDDGKLIGLPINEKASMIWRENYPIDQYPVNNDGTIVGEVLVCDQSLVK